MAQPLITHPTEPRRLLLTWQAPEDLTRDRTRFAVGEIRLSESPTTFHYYDEAEFQRQNQRSSLAELVQLGFGGYPAFRQKRQTHGNEVLQAFLRRLPPRSRPDFKDYLRQFMLAPDQPISDVALLAQTEAKLPSDGFALVDPFDDRLAGREFAMEVAGYRHYVEKLDVLPAIGAEVSFEFEPENEYDPNAIKILRAGDHIGYVGRHRTKAIGEWLNERRISAQIGKLNGEPSRPRAYIVARVSAARYLAASSMTQIEAA